MSDKKFKQGDRVIVNGTQHGKTFNNAKGTVLCYGSSGRVGVEFDENINGHACSTGLVTGKFGHCFWLDESKVQRQLTKSSKFSFLTPTTEICKAAQIILFDHGFKWASGDTTPWNVDEIEALHLNLGGHSIIRYSNDIDDQDFAPYISSLDELVQILNTEDEHEPEAVASKHPTISTGDYTVEFADDGSTITVGCQTINYATVNRIRKHMKSLRLSKPSKWVPLTKDEARVGRKVRIVGGHSNEGDEFAGQIGRLQDACRPYTVKVGGGMAMFWIHELEMKSK